MIAKKKEPVKPPTVKKPATAAKGASKPATAAVKPPAKKPAQNGTIQREKLKKGEIIRLEKVYFDANQYDIKPEVVPALTDLFTFLRANPDVSIEVGGHTNNLAAEKFSLELSTNRARAVADWLIAKGIAADRIQYKGYGWTRPILPNYTEDGRKKNQRVEIKILNING
jgi:outer membrane protein OmpA-like peptidoglycan-associated protein